MTGCKKLRAPFLTPKPGIHWRIIGDFSSGVGLNLGARVIPRVRKLPQFPSNDKRKIAKSIVEKIVIGESEIDVTISYLQSSEELTNSQQQLRGSG